MDGLCLCVLQVLKKSFGFASLAPITCPSAIMSGGGVLKIAGGASLIQTRCSAPGVGAPRITSPSWKRRGLSFSESLRRTELGKCRKGDVLSSTSSAEILSDSFFPLKRPLRDDDDDDAISALVRNNQHRGNTLEALHSLCDAHQSREHLCCYILFKVKFLDR